MSDIQIILFNKNNYWKPFGKFISDQGLSLDMFNGVLFSIKRKENKYDEVFLATRTLYRVLQSLELREIYSLGLYIGMLKGGAWFKPSLPLAHYLAPLCKKNLKCIVLNSNGEKYFLYGKIVDESNTVQWSDGLRLVINRLGEALGWGIGKIANIGGKTRRVVEPVWDMGWYLRRGG